MSLSVMLAVLKTKKRKVGLGLLVLAVLAILKRLRNTPRNVKWAPGRFLVGNLFNIIDAMRNFTLYDMATEWTETLGKTFAFSVLTRNIVMTVDPKNIEHILKTNFQNYIKGYVFTDPFTDLLGTGIFNADGEVWHTQRKTASRMFTKKQFETHIWKVLTKNTSKVVQILDKTGGTTVDLFNLMNRFTLDTIGEIGFSKNVGSMEDPSSPFLESFDRAQQILMLRFWANPYWRVLKFFGLGWEPLLQKHLRLLDDYSRSIVHELYAKAATEEDNSFVGLFLKESLAEKKDPVQLENFMRDMVLNFLIAGRDTTAQAISWTFFELAQHPDVVSKVRDEVKQVCGDGPVLFDHIKQMRYVQAVMDEGLRLHPSVPADAKVCVAADTLPDGTWVPANCMVVYNQYAQGRCKELWGEDAAAFRPERWFEYEVKPSNYVFTAFNAGPRECLGRRLAEMEMSVLVASVVRDFDVVLQVKPKEIRYDVQLTLGMSGLPVTVRRRSA